MAILIGLEHVSHEWPGKTVLTDQTIGINEGDRIGVVGRLVKAEQEVWRRAEIPRDAAHDQCRRHRDLAPVVRLEVLAHGRAADVDLIGQILRVDGLTVHVVAVHQIGQPVAEHIAETAGGLVVVFAHEHDLPFQKAKFFQTFFGKGLTNP